MGKNDSKRNNSYTTVTQNEDDSDTNLDDSDKKLNKRQNNKTRITEYNKRHRKLPLTNESAKVAKSYTTVTKIYTTMTQKLIKDRTEKREYPSIINNSVENYTQTCITERHPNIKTSKHPLNPKNQKNKKEVK
ncbi:hypothetical protein RND81_02G161100 [Saponaria officinalis]|uniref:Uncharacterized protein n=1 Tax=Saponaria officinalis TaxID=3572 RepID=A0AAW1MYE1_SAPOF